MNDDDGVYQKDAISKQESKQASRRAATYLAFSLESLAYLDVMYPWLVPN